LEFGGREVERIRVWKGEESRGERERDVSVFLFNCRVERRTGQDIM
jgi:hypothetical protein